jgi:formylglycine-generating enzyme required for sulfatase activity
MNQPNNIITSLITTLRSHHIEPTAEELADALWFAMQIKPFVAPVTTFETKPSQSSSEKSPPSSAISTPSQAQKPQPSKNIPESIRPDKSSTEKPTSEKPSHLASETPPQTPESYPLYPHTSEPADSPKVGRPLRTPAATMLPDALGLEKALRPLMQWVASQTHYVLDEAATVQQIAEQDIWLPVLQGAPERWFEVALVIEDSASMVIWQPTIAEWRRLLERHGAFSNVQTWRLTYQAGQIQLYAGSRPCQPSELLDPLGRRLILIVTDCVAPAWYTGAMTQLLAKWGQHNPVAIVQMLPQRLWMGSALGEGSRVNLQATAPGLANARLTVDEDDFWFDDQDQPSGIKMPIITLEADSLRFWARIIMGKGDAWTPGIIFESTTELANPASLAPSPPKNSPTAQQRVEHFYATASPTAQKLASYLAAVPLTLPVMRLVQQVMLPQSRQVHLAEVFLGGLLKRISKEKCDPMLIKYDFHDGVRDLMLDSVLIPEAMEVLKTISKYLEKRLGQPLDFMALLADPTATDGLVIHEENRAFAEIGAKVLSRLGGEYRKLATRLVTKKQPLKTFDFKTVTVNAKGKIIHREQKQAQYEIEDLGNGVTLEMVLIPGGTFMMGSPENEDERWDSEGPQHQVTLQGFWLGKYPITQRQWQAVMGNNPSRFKGDNRPVESISWHEVVEFCQRLSKKTGKTYRLPSEAEWEYACRAGTTTPFYFGETITPDLVNYNGGSPYGAAPEGVYRKETTEVGIFPPNAFGLYDMHGNVFEWCADPWHENYEGAPTDGSVWQEGGDESLFALRGGSWFFYAGRSRAAYRGWFGPTNRSGDLGVRLARQ